MSIVDDVKKLIPDSDDTYTEDLRNFFLTIASLVTDDFMDIVIETRHLEVLTAVQLRQIYDSYNGKLTKPGYPTRAFIASTYHLPNLDTTNPNKEWIWVAKLCHLLVYFGQNNLSRRIIETTAEARRWIDSKNINHEIWQHCLMLQADTLKTTYKKFKSYRDELEDKNDIKFNAFSRIYRTIDFAFNEKDSITRASTGRKNGKQRKINEPRTEHVTQTDIDDDTDELVSVTNFEKSKNDNDINRERLDNPIPDFTYIEQTTLKETEKFSTNQIYRRTQAKFAHANKNERFVSGNIRQLPLTTIQNIISRLWQWFDECDSDREKKRAIAYLLLSLYTGHSVARLAEDINNNKKEIIDISARKKKYEFIIDLDITPLRIRTAGIESVIANRLTQFKVPLPDSLGAFLTYKGHPTSLNINEIIADLRAVLELPIISLGRIEKSLYTILIHEVSSSQFATIITSRNSKKRADIWYCSHNIEKIADVYHNAIKILTARCHNKLIAVDYLSSVELSSNALGSQNSPDYPIASLFMNHLYNKVMTTENYIEKFNFYNLWLWHVSLLLTSIRAVEGAPGYLNQMNFEAGIAWISDKEERATGNSQRLVPICSFLAEAVQSFLKYLASFAKRYGRINPNLSVEVDKILASERPLLNFLDEKGDLKSLRPATIIQELSENFRFKPDWTRHVGQRFLHEYGLDEAIILAIFGHEMMGQEAWRKNSALSMGHILSAKHVYQEMVVKLELQQVVL
ncbi:MULTISPECIES: hypothetical protein [Psychrobacter]|uniref:hypothetical protein n=1 Tax=Psychrobacter TaxID=497 RepID=UPI00146C2EA8|nr:MULTISPECIES: hypothetical protein [Psychrobacter]